MENLNTTPNSLYRICVENRVPVRVSFVNYVRVSMRRIVVVEVK